MKTRTLIITVLVVLVATAATFAAITGNHAKNTRVILGPVTNLQAEGEGGSTVSLTWDSLKGASGYEIYRSANNDKHFSLYEEVDGADSTMFTDEDADNKVIYYYKVRAKAAEGGLGEYSEKIPSGELAYQIPVFAYHRFCGELPWDEMGTGDYLFCEQTEFDKQMKYLYDNNYRTITTDEIYKWHEGKMELPKKSVLITMDDGNISVIKYALPILKKYDFTATVFMIGHSTYDVTDPEPYDTDSYHHMGVDMMEQTKAECDNIEFQSHSYDLHRSIDGDRAMEVLDKETLAEDTAYMHDKYGYTSLAYPFGAYSDDMIEVLEENGHYTCAFTYGEDKYTTRFGNRFAMDRIKIYGGTTLDEFKAWLDY